MVIDRLFDAKRRRGISTLVIILLVLSAAIGATVWFRAQVTSSEQEAVLQESEIVKIDNRLQNALQYLETSLWTKTMNGTWESANYSGRKEAGQRYRYWICQEEKDLDRAVVQIPGIDKVRDTTRTFTAGQIERKIEEIEGEYSGYRYELGDLQCIETGYRTPREDQENEEFKSAFNIEGATVQGLESNRTRAVQDITLQEKIAYDRIWWMYEVIRKWSTSDERRDMVKENIKNYVRDDTEEKSDYPVIGPAFAGDQTCKGYDAYPDPKVCIPEHPQLLTREVNNGLQRAVKELEENDKYFGNKGVSCSIDWNSLGQEKYPAHKIEPQVSQSSQYQFTLLWYCCNSGYECSPYYYQSVTPPGACIPIINMYWCWSRYHLEFTSRLDFTLTCKDEKFKAAGQKDNLKPLQWKVDMSYRIEEKEDTDGSYQVSACTDDVTGINTKPRSFRNCKVPKDVDTGIDLCNVGVDTIGELDN